MDWLPLESRMFTAVAYAPVERTLYLRFRSGDVYRYFDLPAERFRELLAADSKGRYFLAQIRDRFHYQRLARLTLVTA